MGCLARLHLRQPWYWPEVFHLTFSNCFPQLATSGGHPQLQQVAHFAPGGLGTAIVNELAPRHVQRNWQAHFKDRALYYVTYPIREQVERGESWPYNLLPVYSVNVLNFRLDGEPRYLRRVQLVELGVWRVFYEKLTFVFVELPKLELGVAELKTATEKWVYLLKNLQSLEEAPPALAEAPYERVFQMTEQAALSPEEHRQYVASRKRIYDYEAVILSHEQLGREEERRDIALAMLAKGMSPEAIEELTGVSADELATLSDEG